MTENVNVTRISAQQLATRLKDPVEKAKIRIVDVRGDDFDEGHIRGALHVPEPNFHDDNQVDNLVGELKSAPVVVFHCMMSQVRGPFCAKRFQARVEAALNADSKPEVLVLDGGFKSFGQEYSEDPELVEGLTKKSE